MLLYSIINIRIFHKIILITMISLYLIKNINNLIVCSNLQGNIISKLQCIIYLRGDSLKLFIYLFFKLSCTSLYKVAGKYNSYDNKYSKHHKNTT